MGNLGSGPELRHLGICAAQERPLNQANAFVRQQQVD
jgi:hypothetical protein